MTFVPARFTTPITSPKIVSQFSQLPYISPSQFRFAPTAVSTTDLVPGSQNQAIDSLASLADVIGEMSEWINTICFHTLGGSLAASIITESDYFKIRPNGEISLICNYAPIWQMLGMGVGPNPSQMSNLDSTSSKAISIDKNILTVPSFSMSGGPDPNFGQWPTIYGEVYVTWQYVCGFPHTSLASDVLAGATSIEVTPTDLTETEFVGVNPSSLPLQMTIRDNALTERIIVTAINGLTLTLQSPLKNAHTVPAAPDFIPVTALPRSIQLAAIDLTKVLLKLRGTKSQIIGMAPGSQPSGKAISEAGATQDYKNAINQLTPYIMVFQRG